MAVVLECRPQKLGLHSKSSGNASSDIAVMRNARYVEEGDGWITCVAESSSLLRISIQPIAV